MANRSHFSEESSERTQASSFPRTSYTAYTEPSAFSPRRAVFLQAVRHEAHLRLDAGRAEGIVAEVESHLTDAWESRIHDGVSVTVAEREVLAGFGDARRFVRGLTDTVHENRTARVARILAFALYLCVLAILPIGTYYPDSMSAATYFPLLNLSLLLVAIGAFFGRKIETKRYLLAGTASLLAVVLLVGFNEVTVDDPVFGEVTVYRNRLEMDRQSSAVTKKQDRRQLALLEEGRRIFSDTTAAIPSRWMPKGQYVLLPDPASSVPPVRIRSDIPGKEFVLTATPTNTTTDRARAIRSWERNGRAWELVLQKRLKNWERYDAVLVRAGHSPWVFHPTAVSRVFGDAILMSVLGYLIAFVVLQAVASILGRRLHLAWMRWLWRLRTTA